MEEFIFVAQDGEVYRKPLIGKLVRHGHIAKEYMELKKLPIIDVDHDAENGYLWGKELAKNHSRFVIQNSGSSGAVYIPSELTEIQKIWIKNNLLTEIEIFNGLLIVCNFNGENMKSYASTQDNVMYELEKCLKEKGVGINIYKEEEVNDIGNKRRYT